MGAQPDFLHLAEAVGQDAAQPGPGGGDVGEVDPHAQAGLDGGLARQHGIGAQPKAHRLRHPCALDQRRESLGLAVDAGDEGLLGQRPTLGPAMAGAEGIVGVKGEVGGGHGPGGVQQSFDSMRWSGTQAGLAPDRCGCAN